MDSYLSGSTDIHQWIKRVQENSERSAEQLFVDAKSSSLLKKAERDRHTDDDIDLEYLKRKYLNQDTTENQAPIPQPKYHPTPPTERASPRQSKPILSPAKSPRPHESPVQPKLQQSPSKSSQNLSHSPSQTPNHKHIDVYSNSYTKFGSPPPDLEDFAHFGLSHPALEAHARVAQNAHDMELMDFDHPPSESEWKRKFSSEKAQDKRHASSIPKDDRTGKTDFKSKESPRREVRIAKEPTRPNLDGKLENDKARPNKEGPQRNESESGLSLIANFDPLAIEAHSILTDWVSGKGQAEDEAKSVPVSRWQQLRAGIHDLEKPSMLLPQPADPHTLSHHTASSRKKIVSDIKEEIKKVNKAPLPSHDPRPKMEARHEQVARMQNQREESKKEAERKRLAEEQRRNEALAHEDSKRQLEKKKQEHSAKEIDEEMLLIKLKREEEAKLIKEEEQKILEAHKVDVQQKLRVEREKELEEARKIEEIRKEELSKRKNLKKNQHQHLAKSHADKKLMQKCLSTWFLHVKELQLKLNKFKVVCDWKQINLAFKTWRRFAQNSKAERDANDFATRAKMEQRNLDRAVLFRDHKVILRCFLIWYSRAKLKGEERQIQEQHAQRKLQMAQFLEKAKQQPSPESPTRPQNSPSAKLKPAGAKKPAPQKGSPNPKPVDSRSPNASPKPKQLGPNSPLAKQAASPNSGIKLAKAELANNPELAQQLDTEDATAIKNYIADGGKLYQEMESRAEQRKNRRKGLELKYQEAQRVKEEKIKQEAENERLKLEAEKQAKIEQKRLAKQKEAANQRRKEIEERSEKLAIIHDGKRLLKFYCWLPWQKYISMRQAKLADAGEYYERSLVSKFTKAWRQVTQQQIEEKLKFADEFYDDVLLERTWKNWAKAIQTIQSHAVQADSFWTSRIQLRFFHIWYQKALVAMDKRTLADLQKELEMDEYYKGAIVKKVWHCWKRYVIITKDERKSEKRKEDMRTKAQGWLQQYRQAKSSPSS